jgi:hypothetical protein
LVVALGLAFFLLALRPPREPAPSEAGSPPPAPAPASRSASTRDVAPARATEVPPARPQRDAPARGDEASGSQPPDDFEIALRWSLVDLDAVRDAMPDNLYWQMSAPTSDEELIRWREEERARWNREYGKVLSGNATEGEIEAYYAHRERVSLDAIEFASHLLSHYGDALPERDVGLLELAMRLHQARLRELPRREAEALDRKQRQDVLRELWRADEEAFEEALRAGDGG